VAKLSRARDSPYPPLYYQKIFRTMVEAMRIERIEGFQPYDQFVEHRLVRSYSVLEAITERHQLVSAREGELRRKLLTAKSVVYQEKLTDFQRRAEYILLFVLTPYYLIGIVPHLWPNANSSYFGLLTPGLIGVALTIVIAIRCRLREMLAAMRRRDASMS
jgi:uncharacterized membrane-anchored protein